MKRFFKRSLTVAIVFSFLYSPSINFAVLNDSGSPAYETLDSIVSELDKEGIDAARNLDSPAHGSIDQAAPSLALGNHGTAEKSLNKRSCLGSRVQKWCYRSNCRS